MRGRKLGRNASHRKAMFRNMACSLIRSVRVDEDDKQKPKVPGRIVTTVAKAKELRPFIEKLVTLARKSKVHDERASEFVTSAKRNSSEWKNWRESDQWSQWAQAVAPAVALRRRAFAKLRDHQAVNILFDELAERFEDRPGGYTRVVRLATVRLGDAGRQALIEFVGEHDRVRRKRKAPAVADSDESQSETATDTDAAESSAVETPESEAATEDTTDESSAAENGDDSAAVEDSTAADETTKNE
jgi:large subunit ribosomal protein L17